VVAAARRADHRASVDRTVQVPAADEDPPMPATPDYIRILSEASDRTAVDPDIAQARARVRPAPRTGVRSAIGRWLAQARIAGDGGPSTPILRDYPWRPADRG
jgi:hypothetical protein